MVVAIAWIVTMMFWWWQLCGGNCMDCDNDVLVVAIVLIVTMMFWLCIRFVVWWRVERFELIWLELIC